MKTKEILVTGPTLIVLARNKLSQDTIIDHCYTDRQAIFNIPEDGWYTVYKIKIPTIEYIDNTCSNNLRHQKNIFVIKDNKLWKYIWRDQQLVDTSIEEILKTTNSNVTIEFIDFFYSEYIKECLIYYIKTLEGKKLDCGPKHSIKFNCDSKSKEDIVSKDRNYINMIKELCEHHASCENYSEAERLIEQFYNCKKYCSNITNSNCGCNGK